MCWFVPARFTLLQTFIWIYFLRISSCLATGTSQQSVLPAVRLVLPLCVCAQQRQKDGGQTLVRLWLHTLTVRVNPGMMSGVANYLAWRARLGFRPRWAGQPGGAEKFVPTVKQQIESTNLQCHHAAVWILLIILFFFTGFLLDISSKCPNTHPLQILRGGTWGHSGHHDIRILSAATHAGWSGKLT